MPAGQGGRLPEPLGHLLLVELALVDVDPAPTFQTVLQWTEDLCRQYFESTSRLVSGDDSLNVS